MVSVLHDGGVCYWPAAVAEDQGQGAGGDDEGEVRPHAAAQEHAVRVPPVPRARPEPGVLRQARLHAAAEPLRAVHAPEGHQGQRPVQLGETAERLVADRVGHLAACGHQTDSGWTRVGS